MTRSDNPFGDLPEWKERQRLQEAQARSGSHPNTYPPQSHSSGYESAASHQPQQAEPSPGYSGGYDHGSQHYASPPAGAYQDGAQVQNSGGAQLHYNVPQQTAQEQQIQGQYASPPHYDPQTQVTYPMGPHGQMHSQPQQEFVSEPAGQSSANGYGLRDGQYGDSGQFGAAPGGYAQAEVGQAPVGYDLSNYSPGQSYAGQQADGFGQAPVYHEPLTGQRDQWNDGYQGNEIVPAHGELRPHGSYDEDDDEYYDDDEDDEKRYSWKLLAAIVVTGAVVTGGGIVLYDTIIGGGNGGEAPIIRADQGPAKTAPDKAGGRQFANQDSKLLGRLDTAGEGNTSARVEPDSTNRVRSVPTVKIGRDGRLILPEAPTAVATTSAPVEEENSATDGSQRIAPGINIVDTLNGSSRSGLGATLPPVRPKEPETAATPQQPKVITRTAVPKVRALNATESGSADASTRRTTNLATAPRSGPPPVPSKSSVGSAWRMTSSRAAEKSQPSVGGIQPTIARPIQPLVQSSPAPAVSTSAVVPAPSATSGQGGGGYVAVLATAATRMKALQSFAELQQKHPTALQGRVPDVQKADLSARGLGIMYRVVVGPPGPRGAASTVCTSLKSEGYTGCWVKSN